MGWRWYDESFFHLVIPEYGMKRPFSIRFIISEKAFGTRRAQKPKWTLFAYCTLARWQGVLNGWMDGEVTNRLLLPVLICRSRTLCNSVFSSFFLSMIVLSFWWVGKFWYFFNCLFDVCFTQIFTFYFCPYRCITQKLIFFLTFNFTSLNAFFYSFQTGILFQLIEMFLK